MPWKFCPRCKEISYSAATRYDSWPCPTCGAELKDEPEYDIQEARALREKHLEQPQATDPTKKNAR